MEVVWNPWLDPRAGILRRILQERGPPQSTARRSGERAIRTVSSADTELPHPDRGHRTWRGERWQVPVVACVFGIAAIASLLLLSWNITGTPDVVTDEVTYSHAGANVITQNRISWGEDPIYVHPPVFFLLIGGWLWLFDAADVSVLDQIDIVRGLTNALSALAVIAVGALAMALLPQRRIGRSLLLASVAMLLVVLDPVVQRYGRIVYMESAAVLISLIAILLSVWLGSLGWQYVLIVGGAFGTALLTKELTIILVAAPLLAALLDPKRPRLGREVLTLGFGVLIWATFPVWSLQQGSLGQFVAEKSATLRRVAGLLQTTGWNREGVSFLDGLIDKAGVYASSYILLALGVPLAIWALRRRREDAGTRLVAAMILLTYAYLGYAIVLGQNNDHFYTYAIIPVSIGVAVYLDRLVPPNPHPDLRLRRSSTIRGRRTIRAAVVVGVLVVSSVISWGVRYGSATDDAFRDMVAYVGTNVPHCALVNASTDPDKYDATIAGPRVTGFTNGPEALDSGVTYFLVSDVEARWRYGWSSPEFEQWIRTNGEFQVAFEGETYGNLALYRVGEPVVCDATAAPATAVSQRSPASALMFLAVLGILVGAVIVASGAVWAWRR